MSGADLLEAWRDHLALARRRSPHTVRAYLAAARRLLAALPHADWSTLAALDAATLRQHLADRRAEGLGNVSAARELSALRAFLAFARERTGDADKAGPRLRSRKVTRGVPPRTKHCT
jgi:integrase/recombinase XerC